jgi:hypothetical protein
VTTGTTFSTKACTIRHQMYFGPVLQVRFQTWKRSNIPASRQLTMNYYVAPVNGKPAAYASSSSWLYGVVQGVDIWVPIFGGFENSRVGASESAGGGGYAMLNMLPRC